MTHLTKEQLALQAKARELAQGEFAATAAETDRTEAYPWDNVAKLRDAGFMGMTLPRSAGGQGLSYLDTVIVIEEMAKACATMSRKYGVRFEFCTPEEAAGRVVEILTEGGGRDG